MPSRVPCIGIGVRVAKLFALARLLPFSSLLQLLLLLLDVPDGVELLPLECGILEGIPVRPHALRGGRRRGAGLRVGEGVDPRRAQRPVQAAPLVITLAVHDTAGLAKVIVELIPIIIAAIAAIAVSLFRGVMHVVEDVPGRGVRGHLPRDLAAPVVPDISLVPHRESNPIQSNPIQSDADETQCEPAHAWLVLGPVPGSPSPPFPPRRPPPRVLSVARAAKRFRFHS
mmetsp:Transcript_8218/g.21167  ORF Transcript_8218/g.21167 Transcript_8218/m.21167 type:complete len:228 (+) Transcript_8218:2773-3456(+)